MSSDKKIIYGVAVGAVVGGLAAFMFGTKRGKDLRDTIQDIGYDVAEDLIDLADAGVERAIDGWYKSQAAREDLSDIARDKIEEVKKHLGR